LNGIPSTTWYCVAMTWLFVDRDTEVRRLQNALSHPLCGVFGAQGVAKSSVLNKLVQLTLKGGHAVVTVQMMGTSENLLYREILAAVLRKFWLVTSICPPN